MNVFGYEYDMEDKEGKKHTTRFQWVSSIELTKRNIEEMIFAGRGRWKIENKYSSTICINSPDIQPLFYSSHA